MSTQLPPRPNLEHLKSQAKELLSDHRNGVNVDRIRRYFPDLSSPALADAQLVLAREYGYESWPKLRSHVLLLEREAMNEQTNEMVRQLVSDTYDPALKVLKTNPALGVATLAAACCTGNVAAVEHFLADSPSAISDLTGPRDWQPLSYVCFSRLLKNKEYQGSLIQTARLLLAAGADANATWTTDGYGATCLYGATGVNNCPELAEMLLTAGAEPNDDESLYHSMELPTPDCLRVLLRNGGDVGKMRNVFARLFDFENPSFLAVVLEECDPKTLPPIIPHALRRGRSASMLRPLIESGADISSPSVSGLTPYQAAVRMGRKDVAELLERNGADTTLRDADRLIGRILQGEKIGPSEVDPATIEFLDNERSPQVCIWAANGYEKSLRALLELGANVNAQDENGWTPLIEASLRGGVSTVRMLLLEFHADPTIIERAHNGHAVGFACHGSTQHAWGRMQDYVDVVETLLENGGVMPTRVWGSPQVQEVLRRRGCPEG